MIAVRVLAARVVRREHGEVGELGGDRAHQRPLAAVAVAAAAEDGQQTAVGDAPRTARRTLASESGVCE